MNRPPANRRTMEGVLWHLLAGTRGGESRIRILRLLADRPHNMNQMARALGMDYKNVMHHVKVLMEDELVEAGAGRRYGEMYFLTALAREQGDLIAQIGSKMEKS